MLEVDKLYFSYGNELILNSISLSLKQGERIVLIGESGCGKTTLLKNIAGFLQPSKGNINVDKEKVLGPNEQLVPGNEKIRLINQDFNLDEFYTVVENIRLKLLRFNKDYIDVRINELLEITGLEKFKNYLSKDLSGGQKQRLAIARALADEPDVLLLDEPFNQLDYFLKQRIENYLDNYLKKYNISVILVSHSADETFRWGDSVYLMKKGKIIRKESADNFYNYPRNKKEAGYFGIVNTVLYEKKYISFRPNQFTLSRENEHQIKLEIINETTIFKGWYYDHLLKYGNKTIHIYSESPLENLSLIYITPINFL